MSGRTVTVNGERVGGKSAPPIRKIMAVVAQLASYMTTLWAVQWIWNDGPLIGQVLIGVAVEVLLLAMKSALFNENGGDDAIGWAGFVIDALVNAGGVLPRAARLITWPPMTALLGFVGISTSEPGVLTIGGFLIAAITGILLSVLPHRLWKE